MEHVEVELQRTRTEACEVGGDPQLVVQARRISEVRLQDTLEGLAVAAVLRGMIG